MPALGTDSKTHAPKTRKKANISFAHAQAISTALSKRDYGPRSGGRTPSRYTSPRSPNRSNGGGPRATGRPRQSGWDFNVLKKIGGGMLDESKPILRLLGGLFGGNTAIRGGYSPGQRLSDLKTAASQISGVYEPGDLKDPLVLAGLLPIGKAGRIGKYMMTRPSYGSRTENVLDYRGQTGAPHQSEWEHAYNLYEPGVGIKDPWYRDFAPDDPDIVEAKELGRAWEQVQEGGYPFKEFDENWGRRARHTDDRIGSIQFDISDPDWGLNAFDVQRLRTQAADAPAQYIARRRAKGMEMEQAGKGMPGVFEEDVWDFLMDKPYTHVSNVYIKPEFRKGGPLHDPQASTALFSPVMDMLAQQGRFPTGAFADPGLAGQYGKLLPIFLRKLGYGGPMFKQ